MGRRHRSLREEPPARPERKRMGHEAPGTILHGPPISVTCECGAKRSLRYGARWTCEECGHTWDTRQIPRAEYAALHRTQLRYRALPVLLGLLVLALAIFFSLTDNFIGVFFLLPVSLTLWFTILRPLHRRRYLAAISSLPRWQLHAE